MTRAALRRLMWRLQPNAAPTRWVRAEAFDPGFDDGDSAYHGVHAAGDGNIYFTLCSHRIERHARLGCFDPAARRFRFLRDIGEALRDEPVRAIGQGKVHAQVGEAAGALYLATVHCYYGDARDGFAPYPGFRLLRFDQQSGFLEDLVHGPAEEEGLITGVLDPVRLVYHGLTYPSGKLCRYDVASGQLTIEPAPCREEPTGRRIRGRPIYPVCRSLGLDADGNVYGACRNGSIWRREPGGPAVVLPGVSVLHGVVPPVDRRGLRDGLWREVTWSAREQCLYGIHAGTQSLFRFDLERVRVEPVGRIGVAAFRRSGHAHCGSQLGLAFDSGERVLYHIAHGPAVAVNGRRHPRTSAYLVSYDLEGGAFFEHGPICTEAGERALYSESLAFDANGALYTMAWVEVTDPLQVPHYRRLRAEACNGECRGEIYRMLLLRLGPEAIGRPAE